MSVVSTNKTLSDKLVKLLMQEQDVKAAVCSQLKGELGLFIRDGQVQKIRYQRDYVFTDPDDFFLDDEEETIETASEPLISDVVYRRFAYLVASAVLRIDKMDYGHLTFKYSFVESENNEYEIDGVSMRFDGEVHVPIMRNNSHRTYI